MWIFLIFNGLGFGFTARAAEPASPVLDWQARSDWLNVKTSPRLTVKAVGDGITDDTDALQAAFNFMAISAPSRATGVYLPPGTYRITRTLRFADIIGGLVVGHGGATILRWDGAVGGTMAVSDGTTVTDYIGLTWDGASRAGKGFHHAAFLRFEAKDRHQLCTYRDITGVGLQYGAASEYYASSEQEVLDCLFGAL